MIAHRTASEFVSKDTRPWPAAFRDFHSDVMEATGAMDSKMCFTAPREPFLSSCVCEAETRDHSRASSEHDGFTDRSPVLSSLSPSSEGELSSEEGNAEIDMFPFLARVSTLPQVGVDDAVRGTSTTMFGLIIGKRLEIPDAVLESLSLAKC